MAASPMITYAGLNYRQNTAIKGGAQVSTWYVGLITNSGYTQALADTMPLTHASFSEPATAFGTTRPTITTGAVANGVLTTSANVEFTNSSGSTQTVYGYFIASSSTVGEAVSTLYATYKFDVAKSVPNGDVLSIPITLTDSN